MQNQDTPTNLVEEELSLRALTLSKDVYRIRRQVAEIEDNLRKTKETLKETEERYRQVFVARLRYLPELPSPTALVTKGAAKGKEVRILFRQVDHYEKVRLLLVTTNFDLPVVDDYNLAASLSHQDYDTWWIDPDAVEELEIS